MEVPGTVVVVTGAARGIGKAMAQAFVRAGATVALADVLSDELVETAAELAQAGGRVLPVVTDTTDVGQVQTLADRVEVELASGRADALTGRYLPAAGDWDALIEQTEDIVADDRLTLRLRS